MNTAPSQLLRFDEYLRRAQRLRVTEAGHWSWEQLQQALATVGAEERGALSLISGCGHSSAEIAPGISMAVQVIKAGGRTRAHAHSFWHVYIVMTGNGSVSFGGDSAPITLAPRDVVFIPPWSEHFFANDTMEDLILYAMQNLPQMSALGGLVRKDAEGEFVIVSNQPQS